VKKLFIFTQEFKIDGQSEIKEPIGMYGGRLESSFHVVGTGIIHKKCRTMHPKFRIELSGLTLEPLASSDAVLSQEERSRSCLN
jgi:cell division protein FtsA